MLEDKKLGETLRFIRKSKNRTQKQVQPQNASRSIVSKHELGMQPLTVTYLEWYLHTLQISVEEFFFIKNDYIQKSNQKLVDEFIGAFSRRDVSKLRQIYKDIKSHNDSKVFNRYVGYVEQFIRTILSYVDGEVDRETSKQRLQALSQQLWAEVNELDEWFLSELRCLNFISYFLPFETVAIIADQLLKKVDRYRHYPNISHLKAAFILNYALLLIDENKKSTALQWLEKYTYLINNTGDIRFLMLLRLRESIIKEDEQTINQLLETVRFMMPEDEIILAKFIKEIYHFFPPYIIKHPTLMEISALKEDSFGFSGFYWVLV